MLDIVANHGSPSYTMPIDQAKFGELSDLNENNPDVLRYFTNAYLQWFDQGADSIRIDTIKHMPHHFCRKFLLRC